jgi:hypothetical protein
LKLTLSIGRAPDNDVVLTDAKVSRYHSRIYKSAGKWHLVDLRSTHGTKLNGVLVKEPVLIKPSDKISVCETELAFDGSAVYSGQGKVLYRITPSATSIKPMESVRPVQVSSVPATSSRVLAVGGVTGLLLVGVAFLALLWGNQQQQQINEFAQVNLPPVEVAVVQGSISLNGGIYSGELKNELPHGYGKLVYDIDPRQQSDYHYFRIMPKGVQKTYEGSWENGKKHGSGKMIYEDGSVLEGFWEQGVYIGRHRN